MSFKNLIGKLGRSLSFQEVIILKQMWTDYTSLGKLEEEAYRVLKK